MLADLHIFWFMIIGAAIALYAVLDGFDLGVGALHLLITKKDEERRVFLNAIGPVWDGNEVWLVIVVGGLFAGFPGAYATLLSAFYLPTTALIVSLIFRAVAIEFRSKHASARWRSCWDTLFSLASLAIAFGAGVVIGNLAEGIPLDANHDFRGGLHHFFHPYALLTGVTAVACFAMHGSIYLAMKTEGELQKKVERWINPLILSFIVFYLVTTIATIMLYPYMLTRLKEFPFLFVVPFLAALAIANIPREIHRGNTGWAFLSSCASIMLLLMVFALGIFPTLVRSNVMPEQNSVTIYNAGASETTLIVLAIIVAIGLPLVFCYGIMLYRIFRGKVKVDTTSY